MKAAPTRPRRLDSDVEETSEAAGNGEPPTRPSAEEMVAPPDAVAARTEPMLLVLVFIGSGLLALALLAACYVAAEILLPIALAFLLMLALRPAMRFAERWHIPRILATLTLLALLFGVATALATIVSMPAAGWAEKLPTALPKLQERLSFLSEPIAIAQKVLDHAQHFGDPAASHEVSRVVAVEGTRLPQRLLGVIAGFLAALLETTVVLFFLLMSGETLLRRLVEVLPNFKNKRQAVEISQQIESDISAYLLTITLINAAVGVAAGLIAWFSNLGDPTLWGTLAFLLNFIPVLGPTVGFGLFLIAGLLSFDTFGQAVLPAALYFAIHIVEGESLTPWLAARRFTLNPVLVIISLAFWYWVWGVPGAVLSTPMLATLKIVCDRVQPLAPFGHLIEG